jgi:hypothetical protein
VTAREGERKGARGVADGLSQPMGWWGKEWADVAHAGKGRGERRKERERIGLGQGCWAAVLFSSSSSFLFLSYTQAIQTIPVEFK